MNDEKLNKIQQKRKDIDAKKQQYKEAKEKVYNFRRLKED